MASLRVIGHDVHGYLYVQGADGDIFSRDDKQYWPDAESGFRFYATAPAFEAMLARGLVVPGMDWKATLNTRGHNMTWERLWLWWHTTQCQPTRWVLRSDGLHRRKSWWARAVHAIQLPLCRWLTRRAQDELNRRAQDELAFLTGE